MLILAAHLKAAKNFALHLFKILLFLNGSTPASFSFIFGLFKQTILFLQQINVKKCQNVHPVGIRRWDSNPRPFEFESSPITTRPGLQPQFKNNAAEMFPSI